MTGYIEQVLHKHVDLKQYESDLLPLILRNNVHLYELNIDGSSLIMIKPDGAMCLNELRRSFRQVEHITQRNCAIYVQSLTYYAKEMLLQEGIPFVWENHLVYLPSLGTMIDTHDCRDLKPCVQISFITQKLLLTAFYDSWNEMTVSKAAEALQVSKMTVTRCFDEIEVLGLPLLHVRNRSRKLRVDPDKQAQWQLIKPALRNPVIRTYRLAEEASVPLIKSGISALSEYSMITDNKYPTLAFEKAQKRQLEAAEWKQVPNIEQPVCIVQELGYVIPFGNFNAVDPLSITLMLTDDEISEPRIESAIKEMLEEYVW